MSSVFDVEMWRDALLQALQRFSEATVVFLPKLAGAIVLIVFGWCVSRLVQSLSRRTLARIGFDGLVARLGLAESLGGAFQGRTLSEVLSRLLFWIVLLTFLLFAADTLELRAITATSDRLIAYLPRVLGAALILAFGLVLGRFVRSLVASGAALSSIEQAPRLAAVANLAVVGTAGVLAMEQLGVSTEILVAIVTALVAALGLTMGAAFALGSRRVVGHVLAGHFLRQRLTPGEEIEIDGIRGVVDRVGTVDTIVRDQEGIISIPNAKLLERTVKR